MTSTLRFDANGDPCSWTIKEPNIFTVGTTYYWRVDEINNLNVSKERPDLEIHNP